MPVTLEQASLAELRALFATLPAPAPAMRHGFFRASFIGPAFIRVTARPTLAITGLPGWQGKKFLNADDATNILKKGDTTIEHLAMRVTPVTSYVDGKPGLALTYPALSPSPSPASGRGETMAPPGGKTTGGIIAGEKTAAPLPWRWVRDEIRRYDDDTILAFTFVDLPLLRRIGFPFLLTREA